jgi:S-adenosylmethionine decarboxylase
LHNAWILVSTIALGALAAPLAKPSWWQRLFGKRADKAVAIPQIELEGGWTLIHAEDPESFEEWLGRDEEGLPPGPGEEPSLGSHLLIELYGCKPEFLETEAYVGDAMRKAAVESKATVVEQSFHEFKPYGVSGAVIIQESHYTIHTWPEHRYAAVDLFYCGGTVLVHKAVEVLREQFQPERIKFLVVRRGLESEVVR